jgi:hypothetical protein
LQAPLYFSAQLLLLLENLSADSPLPRHPAHRAHAAFPSAGGGVDRICPLGRPSPSSQPDMCVVCVCVRVCDGMQDRVGADGQPEPATVRQVLLRYGGLSEPDEAEPWMVTVCSQPELTEIHLRVQPVLIIIMPFFGAPPPSMCGCVSPSVSTVLVFCAGVLGRPAADAERARARAAGAGGAAGAPAPRRARADGAAAAAARPPLRGGGRRAAAGAGPGDAPCSLSPLPTP